MTTIAVETFDGTRMYIQEGESLVTEGGDTLTYTELNGLIVDGTIVAYGLQGVSPIKSNYNSGKRTTKTQRRLLLSAATFMKG